MKCFKDEVEKAISVGEKARAVVEDNENNNENDVDVDLMPPTDPCDLCGFTAKCKSDLEQHIGDAHHEVLEKLTEKFSEHNREFAALLEGVPETDLILMPEEITHLGVDWKIHLEILEILDKKKT